MYQPKLFLTSNLVEIFSLSCILVKYEEHLLVICSWTFRKVSNLKCDRSKGIAEFFELKENPSNRHTGPVERSQKKKNQGGLGFGGWKR